MHLQSSKELLNIGDVSLDVEGNHATEALGQPLGQLVLRVGGESGVQDLGNVGRGLQGLGNSHGVGLVLPHPHVQRLQSSVGQVGVEGTWNAARGYYSVLYEGWREREEGEVRGRDVVIGEHLLEEPVGTLKGTIIRP